jgi:hypothetical protein
MTNLPPLRKRPLEADPPAHVGATRAIDIAGCATIAYSSEQPDHPVEHLLDGHSGLGATRWISACPDTIEHILVEFDRPQTISRLVYEVEETERERTQEVRVEVSEDRGRTYRQILVQEYNFSPGGATYQRQEQRVNLKDITQLRLTIVPNKNGCGTATLTMFRLYA